MTCTEDTEGAPGGALLPLVGRRQFRSSDIRVMCELRILLAGLAQNIMFGALAHAA